jgi:ketosteroid isomerase-like protein
LFAGALLLAFAGQARAEVIELLDKTKISGKIVHYYDGIYSVEAQGQTMKIPRDKIRSISFQLPPSRLEFSSVEKTFERWRKAVTDGDLEKAVDCYALMFQGVVASQMGQSADAIKQMKKEIEGTKFVVKGSSVKGEKATLKVLRQKGEDSETGEIAFVRENGEWKMLPPQPPQ